MWCSIAPDRTTINLMTSMVSSTAFPLAAGINTFNHQVVQLLSARCSQPGALFNITAPSLTSRSLKSFRSVSSDMTNRLLHFGHPPVCLSLTQRVTQTRQKVCEQGVSTGSINTSLYLKSVSILPQCLMELNQLADVANEKRIGIIQVIEPRLCGGTGHDNGMRWSSREIYVMRLLKSRRSQAHACVIRVPQHEGTGRPPGGLIDGSK